ncbi:MAG: tetratricopeptide repeat protein, partial [Acidobacteriota bacterium]
MMLALGLSACLAAAALIGQARSAADMYQEALRLEEVKGDLQKAIAAYLAIVERSPADRGIAAKAQLHIGLCYERMGKAEASTAYEKVVREYPDQSAPAAQAKLRLASLGGPTAQPSEAAVVARQIWSGSDVDLEGRPSADGRLLTFIDWTSTRSGNVAIRNLTTGENRTLTHSSSFAEGFGEYPVLSPDGRQVIFGWYNDQGQTIRVASSDGSRSRVLVRKPGVYTYDLAWSPDGRHVAGIMDNFSGDKTAQMALIAVSDGSVTPLKSMGWRPTSLGGFSPDGRFIVYATRKSGSDDGGGIYSIAVDGSRESALVKGSANDSSPVWTPDGAAVVFISDRSGTTSGLWSIRVEDGKPQGSP